MPAIAVFSILEFRFGCLDIEQSHLEQVRSVVSGGEGGGTRATSLGTCRAPQPLPCAPGISVTGRSRALAAAQPPTFSARGNEAS